MAVHLNLSNLKEKKDKEKIKLHWMPCVIQSDGEAKVSTYFEPIITSENDGSKYKVKRSLGVLSTLLNLQSVHIGLALKASFRGYPLMGKEIKVPNNYTGIVLQGTEKKLNENAERNLYGTHVFDKLTYWNWDEEPSENDKEVSAFEWLEIAEALHSPVEY